MRYPGAYYLLLLYATFVFQPLLLIAEDVLCHTFADAIHIATVHAKYGNNHVEVVLAQTSSDNDSGQNHNSQKSEEQTPVHVSPNLFQHHLHANHVNSHFMLLKLNKLSSVFVLKQYPPPRVFRMVLNCFKTISRNAYGKLCCSYF